MKKYTDKFVTKLRDDPTSGGADLFAGLVIEEVSSFFWGTVHACLIPCIWLRMANSLCSSWYPSWGGGCKVTYVCEEC